SFYSKVFLVNPQILLKSHIYKGGFLAGLCRTTVASLVLQNDQGSNCSRSPLQFSGSPNQPATDLPIPKRHI
ncbi:MAG: hypothetical protein ACE5GZ_13560, partial [Gammaproteobacteria bacterium]